MLQVVLDITNVLLRPPYPQGQTAVVSRGRKVRSHQYFPRHLSTRGRRPIPEAGKSVGEWRMELYEIEWNSPANDRDSAADLTA